jgi:Ca2+-transporting ATPase
VNSTPTSSPFAGQTRAKGAVLSEETGLTGAQARRLLAQHGPNLLVPPKRRSGLVFLLLRAFADPMAVLLLVAGATYLALGDVEDAIVVLAALIPITAVTLVLEARSERALDQLGKMTAPTATVVRDEESLIVPAEELVPGDLVVLHEGDIAPADGLLVSGGPLLLDESALTGESLPVHKNALGVEREIYAGTSVLAGRGRVRLTTTGGATRYGLIGALVARIKQSSPPLERVIHRLVVRLGVVAALLCALVAAIEFARGAGWAAAVIAGVSLAIAAIPEEFPMVYTLYLSLGAWRLARGRALIRRLAGVETLGSTTVICADKTGTLTLGQLDVGGVWAEGESFAQGTAINEAARRVLEAAVLASEPVPFDPLEQALVRYAGTEGIDVAALHRRDLARDYPFDPKHRYNSHVWRNGGGSAGIYAKGALEGVLERATASPELRDQVLAANHQLASAGMRVLGVAAGQLPAGPGEREQDETALQLVGLVAFMDPLRPGVAEALDECRRAGIRVVMITGDHPVTAHAVADGLGLPHDHGHLLATGEELDAASEAGVSDLVAQVNIFARTRPEQKYKLVRALRARGEVVAMTGDGINDAPALREADIGVALGRRGTAVARESATLVLLDDNFATIVNAVRDGRRIFDNLGKAFGYVVAFHVPLVLAALVVPLLGVPLLLLPVHLIVLELVMHPTASIVFEADPAAPDIMRRPPRGTGSGLLAGGHLWLAVVQGVALFLGVLGLYLWSLHTGVPENGARALALVALVLGESALVFVQRDMARPLWRADIPTTRTVWVSRAITLALLVAAVYFAPLSRLLHIVAIGPREWALALVVAVVATAWVEPLKAWRSRNDR